MGHLAGGFESVNIECFSLIVPFLFEFLLLVLELIKNAVVSFGAVG